MDESVARVCSKDEQLIDLTDETVVSTPVPRATSTAQRSLTDSLQKVFAVEVDDGDDVRVLEGVQSSVDSQLRGAVDDLKDLQEQFKAFTSARSTAASTTASSCSSLGLLPPDTLSGFSAASTEPGDGTKAEADEDLALDLSLRLQRALALRSVQRSAALRSGEEQQSAVPGALALATSADARHSYTRADWPPTFLDDVEEVCGSSKESSVSGQHRLGSSAQRTYSVASGRDVADLEDVLQTLADEQFLSQEAGRALLSQDEAEFRKQVPPVQHVPDSSADLSADFSSVRSASHITLGSVADGGGTLPRGHTNKLSIGQFFSLRTEKIEDPGLQCVKTDKENIPKAETADDVAVGSVRSPAPSAACSTVATPSAIQEVLSQLGGSLSGSLLVDHIMRTVGNKGGPAQVLHDRSNLCVKDDVPQHARAASRRSGARARRRGRRPPGRVDASPSSDSDDSVLCLSEVPAGAGSGNQRKRKRDIARWVLQSSKEQTCAGPELQETVCVDGGEGWVHIRPGSATEFVLAVGVLSPVLLTVQGREARWLACKVAYKGAQLVDPPGGHAPVDVELPDVQTVVGPHCEQQLQAWVCPKEAVRMRVSLDVVLKDVSSNEVCTLDYSFQVCGEEPRVMLSLGDSNQPGRIDFGVVAEDCCLISNISLENKCDAFLALALELELELDHVLGEGSVFSLCDAGGSKDRGVLLSVFLREQCEQDSCKHVAVQFHPRSAPTTGDPGQVSEHRATLVVRFDVPNTSTVLKRVSLVGRSYPARVSPRRKSASLVLRGAEGSATVQVASNLGARSVRLRAWLEGPGTDALLVRPDVLVVEAGEAAVVTCVLNPGVPPPPPSTVITGCVKWQLLPGGETVHSVPVSCTLLLEDTSRLTCTDSCTTADRSGVSGGGGGGGAVAGGRVSGGSEAQQRVLKLEATSTVLSFESVSVGRSLKLSTKLRNYATHSCKLRLTISSQGGDFKMLNESGEAVVSRVLKLHAMECKVLKFLFTATQLGAAVGIVLHHQLAPAPAHAPADPRKMLLYGYGGSAKLVLRHVHQDSSDKMWLNMGEAVGAGHTLVRTIVVENRGSLPGFMLLYSLFQGARSLYDSSALVVSPGGVVVQPRCSETVRVEYKLGRKDAAPRGKCVWEVATAVMVLGDEPTRHRLRRETEGREPVVQSVGDCCSLLRLLAGEDERSADGSLVRLCSTFEKEVPIPDVACLKDTKDARRMLCESLTSHVVSVTVESCKDSTLTSRLGEDTIADADNSDVTRLFTSLLHDTMQPASSSAALSCTRREAPEGAQQPGRSSVSWEVWPREVSLAPPRVTSALLTLWNHHPTQQLFEVATSEDWLEAEPRDGVVPPESCAKLRLSMPRWPLQADHHRTLQASVMVYIENDCAVVKVSSRPAAPQPQAVSTPLQPRGARAHQVSPLVVDQQELALPPAAVGDFSSATLGCRNTSDTPIQVDVSASQPFFTLGQQLVLPPQCCQTLQVYFCPSSPGLVQGRALLCHAQHRLEVLLVGRGDPRPHRA